MMLEQESEAEPNTDIVGLAPCWERQNNAPFKNPNPADNICDSDSQQKQGCAIRR